MLEAYLDHWVPRGTKGGHGTAPADNVCGCFFFAVFQVMLAGLSSSSTDLL